MSTPHESAQSLMKLYDLRREPKLREARAWVVRQFNPSSMDDIVAATRTEEFTYVRMVAGYWDMAASFVVHGAIDPEMFRAVSGEMLSTYCKVEPFIDEIRETFGQPDYLRYVQQVAGEWPGAGERMAAMREYFRTLAES